MTGTCHFGTTGSTFSFRKHEAIWTTVRPVARQAIGSTSSGRLDRET